MKKRKQSFLLFKYASCGSLLGKTVPKKTIKPHNTFKTTVLDQSMCVCALMSMFSYFHFS